MSKMYPKVNHKIGSDVMRFKTILVLATILTGSVTCFFILNPLDFFVPKSSKFSWTKFRELRPGSRLDEAIESLGAPVKVGTAQDSSCPNCRYHIFLGDPPWWLLSHREAWVVTNEAGEVVQVLENSEP